MCVRACVRACVCVCVRACVFVCVCVCVCHKYTYESTRHVCKCLSTPESEVSSHCLTHTHTPQP